MADYLEKFGEWHMFTQRIDDDFYDRLNHQYSVVLLIAASLLAGSRQLVSEKIRCFTPPEFTYHQTHYVNDYCYVASTYYVPYNTSLPGPKEPRSIMINYYQWVTMLIFVQAVMFFIPKLLWRVLSHNTGYCVSSIAQLLPEIMLSCGSVEKHKRVLQRLVLHTDRYLESYHSRVSSCTNQLQRNVKSFSVIIAYTFAKFVYIINAIGQIFIINKFLGDSGYTLWGFHICKDLLTMGTVKMSKTFPIETMCDVKIRVMGNNLHFYAIQCVLPVNVFHDRVYLIIWFWLSSVVLSTIYGLVRWLKFLYSRADFVKMHLHYKERCGTDADLMVLYDFLENTSSLDFDEYLTALWDNYVIRRVARQSTGQMDESVQLTDKYLSRSCHLDSVDGDGDYTVTL